MPGVKFVAAKRDFKAAHAAHVSKSFTSLNLRLKQNHRKQIVARATIQVAIAILQLSSLEPYLSPSGRSTCVFVPATH